MFEYAETSKTEVFPRVGAVIGWVLGLLIAVMLRELVVGAGITTVLTCGICGLILGVVVSSWTYPTHESRAHDYDYLPFYITAFVGAACGVVFGIIFFIAGVTFTTTPVFTIFTVSLFTAIGYFRVPFLMNWIEEKRRREEGTKLLEAERLEAKRHEQERREQEKKQRRAKMMQDVLDMIEEVTK